MIGSAQLIGAQLGNYEIQALLGAGGMASVYRGFDRNLRRPVAIKVLPDLAAQPDFSARFLQEARLIAGLRHPNIVQVYDFGQHDGLSYMVQELLSGPTLQQWMHDLAARGERPSRDDVLSIVGQLASALDTAHAAGIIHRDVKPANIMIRGLGTGDWGLGTINPSSQSPSSSPQVVLTDFGIAKNSQLPALTQAGVVIGTPDYLSPEQAKGLPVRPSSDIYSLGVVLYELLAGRLPFVGSTPLGVAMSHIQDTPPPLRSLRPDLPAAVDALVQQALSKDPSARFHTAGALAHALAQAWPATGGAAAPPAGIHEQSTRLWDARAATPPAAPAARPAPTVARFDSTAQPAPAAPASSPPGRVMGIVLLALLIGGAILLGRMLWWPSAVSPAAPAETIPAASQPSSAPVAQASPAAAPTAVPEPTTAPATAPPAPTAAPATVPSAPTAVPATAPPAPTAAPSAPLDQLGALLEAGKSDGRAGKAGGAMLSDLSKAKQALDDGNKQRAADRLRDLQKRLLDGVKSKKVDADFARQALAGINAVAGAYGLELPPLREQGD
jgi:serine/threonine protein kinase